MIDPRNALTRAQRTSGQSTISNSATDDIPADPAQLATMERAMRALPRLTREIFLAHRLDRLGYDEIGRIVGITPRQVERHVARAFHQLSRYLNGDERTPWQRRWHSFLARLRN
ncbi:RNA polymerase sigma factor [Sphingomonas sp. GB1N7]|uniref:RNA polymerase sigma factor n=1 Tax=Parasphingomonas caseinilytica TaxID=3096158 RepID=UPI002FC849D8